MQSLIAVLENLHPLRPSRQRTDGDEHAGHSVGEQARCYEAALRLMGEYVLRTQFLHSLVIKSDTCEVGEVHQLGETATN